MQNFYVYYLKNIYDHVYWRRINWTFGVIFVSLFLGAVYAEGITQKLVDSGSQEVLECFIKNNKSEAKLIRWVKYSGMFPILIFQQMQHYPEFIKNGYLGRVRLVNQSSLELSDIRSSDEGLYECSITHTDGGKEELTHVHLKVKGKGWNQSFCV